MKVINGRPVIEGTADFSVKHQMTLKTNSANWSEKFTISKAATTGQGNGAAVKFSATSGGGAGAVLPAPVPDSARSRRDLQLLLPPDGWGSGIAAALMTETLSQLHDDGYSRVHLWTLRDTPQSRRFYTKCGFTESGAARAFVVDPDLADIDHREPLQVTVVDLAAGPLPRHHRVHRWSRSLAVAADNARLASHTNCPTAACRFTSGSTAHTHPSGTIGIVLWGRHHCRRAWRPVPLVAQPAPQPSGHSSQPLQALTPDYRCPFTALTIHKRSVLGRQSGPWPGSCTPADTHATTNGSSCTPNR